MSNVYIKPYQFRYFAGDEQRSNVNLNSLASGDFLLGYKLISQVGIQSTPGIRFKINAEKDVGNWIEMNDTGIYELDLREKGNITSIAFDINSFSKNSNIEKNNEINEGLTTNFFILIDIIYGIDEEKNINKTSKGEEK